MKKVYVTIYRHILGNLYVQINATEEGQLEFIKSLNKDLFIVESIGLQKIED